MPSATMRIMTIPRAGLSVACALLLIERAEGAHWKGASYEGLRMFLGLRSSANIRRSVRIAQTHDLVSVEYLGAGSGGIAVIRLTTFARELFAAMTQQGQA